MPRLEGNIPPEHYQALERHARANDRTMAAEVRRMVRMYLRAIERPASPAANGSAPAAAAPITGA